MAAGSGGRGDLLCSWGGSLSAPRHCQIFLHKVFLPSSYFRFNLLAVSSPILLLKNRLQAGHGHTAGAQTPKRDLGLTFLLLATFNFFLQVPSSG